MKIDTEFNESSYGRKSAIIIVTAMTDNTDSGIYDVNDILSALDQGRSLLGRTVTLRGILAGRVKASGNVPWRDEDVYFHVADASEPDKSITSRAISLDVPGLFTAMADANVPPLGGGGYIYHDDVVVSGVLSPSKSEDYPLALTEVRHLVMEQDGIQYTVPV